MKFLQTSYWQSLFNKTRSGISCGISIHNNTVRMVKLERQSDGIKCVASQELPYSGDEQLSKALTQLIETYKLQECITSIVLPPHRVQSSQLEQPELPKQDIQKALPWQCKELFTIPPQDMVCDYIDMPLQPAGQSAKANVFAVSKTYIEMLVTPFHIKKAKVQTITIEQLALAQLQNTKDAAQLGFIQHKDSDGVLAIIKNRQICFTRKLRGMQMLSEMTDEQLQSGGSDTLTIELQRSIDFYESQLKQPPIKNAVIAMEGSNSEGVIKAINMTLPVRAKQFTVDEITNSEVINQKLLTALGVALSLFNSESEEASNEA